MVRETWSKDKAKGVTVQHLVKVSEGPPSFKYKRSPKGLVSLSLSGLTGNLNSRRFSSRNFGYWFSLMKWITNQFKESL